MEKTVEAAIRTAAQESVCSYFRTRERIKDLPREQRDHEALLAVYEYDGATKAIHAMAIVLGAESVAVADLLKQVYQAERAACAARNGE